MSQNISQNFGENHPDQTTQKIRKTLKEILQLAPRIWDGCEYDNFYGDTRELKKTLQLFLGEHYHMGRIYCATPNNDILLKLFALVYTTRQDFFKTLNILNIAKSQSAKYQNAQAAHIAEDIVRFLQIEHKPIGLNEINHDPTQIDCVWCHSWSSIGAMYHDKSDLIKLYVNHEDETRYPNFDPSQPPEDVLLERPDVAETTQAILNHHIAGKRCQFVMGLIQANPYIDKELVRHSRYIAEIALQQALNIPLKKIVDASGEDTGRKGFKVPLAISKSLPLIMANENQQEAHLTPVQIDALTQSLNGETDFIKGLEQPFIIQLIGDKPIRTSIYQPTDNFKLANSITLNPVGELLFLYLTQPGTLKSYIDPKEGSRNYSKSFFPHRSIEELMTDIIKKEIINKPEHHANHLTPLNTP